MKLSDLTPKSVSFKTCGLELTFRPFTIADDLKARELCGSQEKFVEAMQSHNFEKISLICWYQLKPESQKLIIDSITAENYDPETGEKEEVKLTPINKFRHVIIGFSGQIDLIDNLLKCKGLNLPEMSDEELKKVMDQLEKIESQQK